MIKIDIPAPNVTITERQQSANDNEPKIKPIHGFIDFHQIPRDKGGIFMFYNIHDEPAVCRESQKVKTEN